MKSKPIKKEERPSSEKSGHQNPTTKKSSAQQRKLPTKMGYHGTDNEKNLNPEE
jgi:hypothetical protein